MIIDKIILYLNRGSARSSRAKKNIIYSLVIKFLAILCSLLIVPLTLSLVKNNVYGLWLTIASLIQWVSFFDLGLSNGFRNKFAEAIANNDIILAKKYVSSTFFLLTIIFSGVMFLAMCLIFSLNWSSIFNLPPSYNILLRNTMLVVVAFFCLQMILNTTSTMLYALQRPSLASLLSTGGQVISLLMIFFLWLFHIKCSLILIGLIMSSSPCFVMLLYSFYVFRKNYANIRPDICYVDSRLFKNIIGIGSKFLIIQLCGLFIYQFTNLIITRENGPSAVTDYNISFKYFNVIVMFENILITPYWSAFTDAFVNNDFAWMKNIYIKLHKITFFIVACSIIMFALSPVVYKFWVGNSVHISWNLSLVVYVYMIASSLAAIPINLLNGTGKIKVQTYVYILASLISVPLMYLLCKFYGITFMILVPIGLFIVLYIIGDKQLKLLMNNKAFGIWNK